MELASFKFNLAGLNCFDVQAYLHRYILLVLSVVISLQYLKNNIDTPRGEAVLCVWRQSSDGTLLTSK